MFIRTGVQKYQPFPTQSTPLSPKLVYLLTFYRYIYELYVESTFLYFFSCLTIVIIMGFHVIMGFEENVCCRFFLNSGKIQDGRHLCQAKQLIAIIYRQK